MKKLLKSFRGVLKQSLKWIFQKYFKATSNQLPELGNVEARHVLPSVIYSQEDLHSNQFLVHTLCDAASAAQRMQLDIRDSSLPDAEFYNKFPGEHYRLLAGLAKTLKPRLIIEVGTYTGMGTISLRQGNSHSDIVTFDLFPWDSFDTHLSSSDFDSGKITQVLADLSDQNVFSKYTHMFNDADLIFVDAPKDGTFEYEFLPLLKNLSFRESRVLVLDDIHFLNMTNLWRSIASPKIIATSFGHWSGTGLVDISQGLLLSQN